MINNYCVIIPIYNEEKYLDTFLNSLVKQTHTPDLVILVDDSSTDQSANIIKKFQQNYKFLKYVFNNSASGKVQGKKVINAFNFGLTFVEISNYLFISKIDADLELPLNYFERISDTFTSFEDVGIAGGRIVEYLDGNWVNTLQADYHIRGALKSYRVSCFEEIGGLLPVLGWDGIDEMKALFSGWKTKIVDLDVKHFRPAASDYNYKDLCFKLGFANYCNGSNFFLAFVRGMVRSFRKYNPFIFYYFISGYLSAKFQNHPKNVSADLARFINKFHFRRILSNF